MQVDYQFQKYFGKPVWHQQSSLFHCHLNCLCNVNILFLSSKVQKHQDKKDNLNLSLITWREWTQIQDTQRVKVQNPNLKSKQPSHIQKRQQQADQLGDLHLMSDGDELTEYKR